MTDYRAPSQADIEKRQKEEDERLRQLEESKKNGTYKPPQGGPPPEQQIDTTNPTTPYDVVQLQEWTNEGSNGPPPKPGEEYYNEEERNIRNPPPPPPAPPTLRESYKANTGAMQTIAEKAVAGIETIKNRKGPTPVTSTEINRGDVRNVSAKGAGQMSAVNINRGDVRDVQTQLNKGPQDQSRNMQMELARQLQAQASGQAPSIAEMQAKRSGDRALAQQLAMAAGTTGSGAALARRTAAQKQAQIGADIAATSAQARLAEQLQAQQQLGQVSGQMRGQDISLSTAEMQSKLQADLANQGIDFKTEAANAAAGNAAAQANLAAVTAAADRDLKAQLANQGVDLEVLKDNAARGDRAAIANMEAELKKMGLDDAMTQAYMKTELDAQKTKMDMEFKLDALAQTGGIEAEKLAIMREQLRNAKTQQEVTAIWNAVSGGFGMATGQGWFGLDKPSGSDIKLKKNIKLSGDKLTDFLEKLETYDYEYKDSKFGEGPQHSIMAQDLEKTLLGRKAVKDTPDGKMVNYAELLPTMLAANIQNHKKISALEEALLKKKKSKK